MSLMIREERLKRRWTQDYVATAIGITKAAYSNIESGIRNPSYHTLIKLLDLFEYDDPRKLFGVAVQRDDTTHGSCAN